MKTLGPLQCSPSPPTFGKQVGLEEKERDFQQPQKEGIEASTNWQSNAHYLHGQECHSNRLWRAELTPLSFLGKFVLFLLVGPSPGA